MSEWFGDFRINNQTYKIVWQLQRVKRLFKQGHL